MPASTYNRRIEPPEDGMVRLAVPAPCRSDCPPYTDRGLRCPDCTGDTDLPIGWRWVITDDEPHDAAAEHHSPEESTALLRAELDACRAEILRLREALRFCAEERVVPGEDWEAGCGCCSSGRVTFPESVAATIASVLGRSS